METKVITYHQILKAVDSLLNSVPVVFPTETVYGLGASIFDEEAVKKIFSIKGRPHDNPLIAHVSCLEMVKPLVKDIPDAFYKLADAFWPGPLAIVLPKNPIVSDFVTAGNSCIAIRMPSHPIALKLIEKLGSAIVAPSANLSGKPSPTNIQDVLEDLNGRVPYIIDGGVCEVGIESTVISLASEIPVILRPGKITKDQIESVLKVQVNIANKDTPIQSPGMKYRHYAPKAKLQLIYDASLLLGSYVLKNVTAKSLYSDLRTADRLGVEEIQIFISESIRNDAALMNRLLKAASVI